MSLPLPTIAARVVSAPALTFPQMSHKVALMAGDSSCSAQLVASVIISDPMLSAVTLSRANVATASSHNAIHQVSNAVVLLGLGMVHGIALEMQAAPAICNRHLAACWSLSNACATMCRILTGICPSGLPKDLDHETAILHGLLHDLGSIVSICYFYEHYRQAEKYIDSDQDVFLRQLQHQIGLSSSNIGALIAKSWHLPDSYVTSIRYQHKPDEAPSNQGLVALVHIARILVRGCGFVVGHDQYVEPINDKAMETLGIRHGILRRDGRVIAL